MNILLSLLVAYWGTMGIDAKGMSTMGGLAPIVSGAPSVFWNPGGIPFSSNLTASFAYAIPYELNDLKYGEAAVALKKGDVAFALGYSGKAIPKVYGEHNIVLGTSVRGQLNGSVSAGVGVVGRNFRVSAENGYRYSRWVIDAGVAIHAGPLRFSYVFQNIAYTRNDLDYLKSIGAAVTGKGITAGFAYHWHRYYETYSLFSEVVILKVLALRVGYSRGNMGIGAGIIAKDYYIDFGMNEFDAGTGYSITFGITR